ncbi:hypothetical protein B0T13DRAFT_516159 [Neurospora crassa]|nr:hypothetical protein B0T13DRAFT_516159 [Neurospora crassa]
MSPPPHGPRHRGYHSYNNNPDSNSNCSAPPTPPGSIPSPSMSFPGLGSAPNSNTTTITSTNPSNSYTSLNNMTHHPNLHVPSTQSQQSTTSGTDRTATAHAATTLLTTLFPPYSQTNQLIASLSAELDALKARQRIWKRLAHAAVLFSSDHELRYSLLDKCNDLAECMKMYPRLREEVAKMNEVELQLFSISSTAKQLVGDVEWVRAEDVRGFVEGVRRGQLAVREGGIQNGEGEGIIDGKGTGGMVQVKLDKGRGDVGRRLNYLMVTSSASTSAGQSQSQNHQGPQAGTQVGGGGGGGGGGGQGEVVMGEAQGQHSGRSRRSSTTTTRTARGQQLQLQPQPHPQSQIQSYIAAQAVAAAAAAAAASASAGGQPQQQQHQEEPTWSSTTLSAESSAGRASPGPSEGESFRSFRSSKPPTLQLSTALC